MYSHSSPCHANHCLYLPLSLCSLNPYSFTEFSPTSRTIFIWVLHGSDKCHHQPQVWQHSKNSVMLLYFDCASLCICLFQTGWQTKMPYYQEEKLFKLMASTGFFAGVAILIRFASKSIYIYSYIYIYIYMWGVL